MGIGSEITDLLSYTARAKTGGSHCARENRRFYIAQAHTGAPASSQIFTVLRISDSQDPKISRGERFWKPKREVSKVDTHPVKVADPLRTFKPVPQDSGSRYSTK